MRDWNTYDGGPELCCEARVDPDEIGYLCALLEAYEGLGVVRTKDQTLGIVEFWISPGMKADFAEFIAALDREISITAGPILTLDTSKLDEKL